MVLQPIAARYDYRILKELPHKGEKQWVNEPTPGDGFYHRHDSNE